MGAIKDKTKADEFSQSLLYLSDCFYNISQQNEKIALALYKKGCLEIADDLAVQAENMAEQEIVFTTPKESADIGEIVTPENGSTVTTNPILSVNVTDVSGDDMTVTFKKGEHYELADTNITADSGISGKSKSAEKAFEENSQNGFPYECFDILLDDNVDENTVIDVKWTGNSNSEKTFM